MEREINGKASREIVISIYKVKGARDGRTAQFARAPANGAGTHFQKILVGSYIYRGV